MQAAISSSTGSNSSNSRTSATTSTINPSNDYESGSIHSGSERVCLVRTSATNATADTSTAITQPLSATSHAANHFIRGQVGGRRPATATPAAATAAAAAAAARAAT